MAVVTPAAVVPLAASPVLPLPAAPLDLTSNWYPLDGAGDPAVHEIVAVVVAIYDTVTAVGLKHVGTCSQIMLSR